MSAETIAINALTDQTTTLLEACLTIKTDTSDIIADAVLVSENAAISPLISMATNTITLSSLVVSLITPS